MARRLCVIPLNRDQPASVPRRRAMIVQDDDSLEGFCGVVHAAELKVGRPQVAQDVEVRGVNLGSVGHYVQCFVELWKTQFVLAEPRVVLLPPQAQNRYNLSVPNV